MTRMFNPYQLRLWLGELDHELLNDRQKRELIHFLRCGPQGCDSWNYKLAQIFHISKRTLQYDLRHLESNGFIDIRGALGKHRRIVTLPFPTKASWMAFTIKEWTKHMFCVHPRARARMGAKFCTHHKESLREIHYNQTQRLLYSESPQPKKSESGETPDESHSSSATKTCGSGVASPIPYALRLTRRTLIDRLILAGYPRARAIRLADRMIADKLKERAKDQALKNAIEERKERP